MVEDICLILAFEKKELLNIQHVFKNYEILLIRINVCINH